MSQLSDSSKGESTPFRKKAVKFKEEGEAHLQSEFPSPPSLKGKISSMEDARRTQERLELGRRVDEVNIENAEMEKVL